MPGSIEALERIVVESRHSWRSWLESNHAQSESVWVVKWKKESGGPYVPYADLRDEALCFGWIDSLPRKLDQKNSMLLMSPRRPRSAWSAVNKARIEHLLQAGRMAAPGLAAIARAKLDGSWSILDSIDLKELPDDLMAALAGNGSLTTFQSFPPSSRRGILEWIALAKHSETRLKRIAETARLAAMGVRANHPEAKGR